MGKFKIGQQVVTNRFKGELWERKGMEPLVGRNGFINDVSREGNYFVYNYWWPESALTLVEDKKDEFVWNDILAMQYSDFYRKRQGSVDYWGIDIMEDFKKLQMNTEKTCEVKPDEVVYILQQDWVTPNFTVLKGSESIYNECFNQYLFRKNCNKEINKYAYVQPDDEILKESLWFKVKEQPLVGDIGINDDVICFDVYNYKKHFVSIPKKIVTDFIIAFDESKILNK